MIDQKRLCSEREDWRGCNRVYWLARVVAIGDLWQSDQNLIQFFGFDQKRLCSKREEWRGGMGGGMGGGKELFSLTESKQSAT